MLWSGICVRCKALGACAHHIVSKASNPQLRYILSNGIYVCVGCHAYFESTAGFRGTMAFLERELPDTHTWIVEHRQWKTRMKDPHYMRFVVQGLTVAKNKMLAGWEPRHVALEHDAKALEY